MILLTQQYLFALKVYRNRHTTRVHVLY